MREFQITAEPVVHRFVFQIGQRDFIFKYRYSDIFHNPRFALVIDQYLIYGIGLGRRNGTFDNLPVVQGIQVAFPDTGPAEPERVDHGPVTENFLMHVVDETFADISAMVIDDGLAGMDIFQQGYFLPVGFGFPVNGPVEFLPRIVGAVVFQNAHQFV